MVGLVGRKKKDADRVGYNMSRSLRKAVLNEADKEGWNEIDMIEHLLKYGLAAKNLLKRGSIQYSEFSEELDKILDEKTDSTS